MDVDGIRHKHDVLPNLLALLVVAAVGICQHQLELIKYLVSMLFLTALCCGIYDPETTPGLFLVDYLERSFLMRDIKSSALT